MSTTENHIWKKKNIYENVNIIFYAHLDSSTAANLQGATETFCQRIFGTALLSLNIFIWGNGHINLVIYGHINLSNDSK